MGINIKMMSPYIYKKSYYKNKPISRPSYLYNGNPHTSKDGLCIETICYGIWQFIYDTSG